MYWVLSGCLGHLMASWCCFSAYCICKWSSSAIHLVSMAFLKINAQKFFPEQLEEVSELLLPFPPELQAKCFSEIIRWPARDRLIPWHPILSDFWSCGLAVCTPVSEWGKQRWILLVFCFPDSAVLGWRCFGLQAGWSKSGKGWCWVRNVVSFRGRKHKKRFVTELNNPIPCVKR